MEKRATTLELFFDLVFVLAITEVTALVGHDLTFSGFAHGALIMAILWWGWTQYAWAANAIDLDPRPVRVTIILAMGVVLVMAQAVPYAFGDGGPWLAIGYAALRGIGVWKQWAGTVDDPGTRRALPTFIRWSSIGPIVIIVGSFIDDPARSWIWLAGLGFEALAALKAARGAWSIQAEHFAERHALITIIALGESIVAIGAGAAGELPRFGIAVVLVVALAGTALLWWAYFDWLQDHWEDGLKIIPHGRGGSYARDVYSLLHYPMISGIVLYAVAAEEMVAHPGDPLSDGARVALALGLVLYLGGQIAATYRSSGRILRDRIGAAALIPVLILVSGGLLAGFLIGLVMTLLLAALLYEHRAMRGRVTDTAPAKP